MKVPRLTHAMNYIEDDLIAEALRERKPKKKSPHIKWIATAACLCLFLGTLTVEATMGLGTQILDIFTAKKELGSDYTESGYVLSADVIKFSIDMFSEAVQGVPAILQQQIIDYKSYQSHSPYVYYKEFSTAAEARTYLGFPLLRGLNWDLEEQYTQLSIDGNRYREIQSLRLETYYEVGDIRLQAFAHLWTNAYTEDIILRSVTTENVTFKESYIIENGQQKCHVIQQTAMNSGFLGMDGYVVQDGILYSLHIAYLKKDAAQAKDLLLQWANLLAD